MQRYLAAVQPLMDDEQFKRTSELVEEFLKPDGPGPPLQQHLLQKRDIYENWAYQWWLEDMYMNNMLPLPVNSNPGMAFPAQSFHSIQDQLVYAAKIVNFLMDYKDILDRRALPVDLCTSREKGQPLCMEQYYRLFTTYRVPALPRDYQRSTRTEGPCDNEHIIVAYKREFYLLKVKVAGWRLTEAEIVTQLHRIVQTVGRTAAIPVGILTAERRDVWAHARDALRSDPTNRNSLEFIETSSFLLCLDEPLDPRRFNSKRHLVPGAPNTTSRASTSRDDTSYLHQMLHGGGSRYNTSNRWFDKTLQVIVGTDGAVGLCYEHSPAEGIAVVQLIDDFIKKLRDHGIQSPGGQPSMQLDHPRKLQWNIGQEMQRVIQEAPHNIDRLIDELDLEVYRYNGYGKDFIKSCKISPDAYLQLALQLTYYGLHRKMVATYESASTRRFRLGRVDCIRSAHMDALLWIQAMVGEAPDEDKAALFWKAVEAQTEIMTQNILGEGIDVHLLGLREVAKEMGQPIPELFEDESYRVANHFSLSTSQIPTNEDTVMGYGAVVPDGYGAAYNPHTDCIVFSLSCFRACENTSTLNFADCLSSSLDAMMQMLQRSSYSHM